MQELWKSDLLQHIRTHSLISEVSSDTSPYAQFKGNSRAGGSSQLLDYGGFVDMGLLRPLSAHGYSNRDYSVMSGCISAEATRGATILYIASDYNSIVHVARVDCVLEI